MNLRTALSTFRGHRVPHVDFIGRRNYWFALSGVLIALSLFGLFYRGLNFSIAFTGGASLEFQNASGASVSDYRDVMSSFGRGEASIEILGADTVSIRTESLTELDPQVAPPPTPSPSPVPSGTASGTTPSPSATASASPSASASPTTTPSPSASASGSASPGATASPASASPQVTPSPSAAPATPRADRLRAALARVAGISPDGVNQQDVGPTWGSTISRKAIQGLIVFLILVTLYITLRFEWKMAVGALAALGHDLIVTAGIYALVGREVTPETVVAILTILGYSLYDTVVIFDKVKENTESAALVARETYSGVVNMSLNQTLMRSVNTSLVVLLPIGALLLFGGPTLKDFAFALFIGVGSGTYSSVFMACPVLALFKEREPRFQQVRARAQARAQRPGLRAVEAGAPGARTATADRELEPAAAGAATIPRESRTTTPPGSSRNRGAAARKKKGRPQGRPKPRRR